MIYYVVSHKCKRYQQFHKENWIFFAYNSYYKTEGIHNFKILKTKQKFKDESEPWMQIDLSFGENNNDIDTF